ncbi:dienelactone hydrolase family protein [Bermanella sp. WJH001]|uniref:poly(ethylene terephthalate) hydrolase family protein n=1 Tax=Bermanella sp. WJH001 TaxID=3048005 RepID=UPI0024BD6231|nr:dienelactone hydrolase family protein [Bermanella sp. WJH001]MDJ1537997.1 dienelactone hydrolase family protein [Bermanella sp. WJH001]
MKKNIFKNACLSAAAIAFSLSAHSGGGGDGGGSDGLPLPDTCTSNCGYEVGPNPTLSALQASQGPLSVSSTIVPSSVNGFGGGTIYYPSNAAQELAAIAVAPGFTNYQSAIQWWGPLLASHGYVVITIDTNGRFDNPSSRSLQLDAALSHLIAEGKSASSAISGLVDENRLATMGFSMGGGGSLISASRNRLSAAVPLAPWNSGGNNFDQIGVPTMIMACENDSTASVNSHASPFYNTIPNSTDKAYMEITNGPHNCANGNNGNGNDALLSTYGVSWMKRFLDKDQRYAQFLCGPNHMANPSINEYRDTCNY